MTTTNNEFRHPFYEAMAKYQRAQISLVDQQFAAFMSAQNFPNLSTVFSNELLSIDSEVYKLQVGYLNTILSVAVSGRCDWRVQVSGRCRARG